MRFSPPKTPKNLILGIGGGRGAVTLPAHVPSRAPTRVYARFAKTSVPNIYTRLRLSNHACTRTRIRTHAREREEAVWSALMLPNNIIVKGLRVGDGEFQGFDMLLGMDVISLGDFHLTNDGNTVFKFTIPSESHKDK